MQESHFAARVQQDILDSPPFLLTADSFAIWSRLRSDREANRKETRDSSRDRANGRVSETLGKAAQGLASLGRVRLPNIQAPSNAACRRHGAKIHVKPRDRNMRLYRPRATAPKADGPAPFLDDLFSFSARTFLSFIQYGALDTRVQSRHYAARRSTRHKNFEADLNSCLETGTSVSKCVMRDTLWAVLALLRERQQNTVKREL
ncbi:hypothetical protein DBV15_03442 [Temnothorax longispinosus]|uniref:Uncharacterized protein n=1 Tax=Temnothorax longispinosus TaxID=300112 RepID=A0A4S2KIA3_9HYME|nr:hypothetical protein DBV15_03442 [Temnothorax longispinosus]